MFTVFPSHKDSSEKLTVNMADISLAGNGDTIIEAIENVPISHEENSYTGFIVLNTKTYEIEEYPF